MRKFMVILSLASAVFFLQWRHSNDAAGVAATRVATQSASSTTPRPVYENDWAKHSLDRAQAVVSRVQASRQESEPR